MVYVGSKARIADEILPIILENRKPGQLYAEPFMGGGNVICKVKGPRWGNDINKFVIEFFKAHLQGWTPPKHLTSTDHKWLRDNQDKADPVLVAYAGLMFSFRSKWFGGYMETTTYRGVATRSKERNEAHERYKNALKMIPFLKGVKLTSKSYSDLNLSDAVVYCDPPYASTHDYQDKFDHKLFWSWVRSVSRYNQVFVSEYHAPKDFKCIWSKEVKSNLGNSSLNKIEKLWILK